MAGSAVGDDAGGEGRGAMHGTSRRAGGSRRGETTLSTIIGGTERDAHRAATRRHLTCLSCAAAAALLAGPAGAQGAARTDTVARAVAPTFSWRTRVEQWQWFDAAAADGSYAYVGSLLRAGLAGRTRNLSWAVEASAPLLLGLPEDAAAPAPQGQLGLGAAYSAANEGDETVASVFLKQAFVRMGAPPARGGHALRVGRFEYAEGSELPPANATLAAVKRDRVAHRLLGNFGWSHAQRSLDGAHYTYTRPGAEPWDLTLVAAFPVEGVFRADAWRPLDVGVLYGAYTKQYAAAWGANDARLFALHYRDWRDLAPVDARPATTRAAERGVTVSTVGAHWLLAAPIPAGVLDVLTWGTVQTGRWGSLDHRAHALALEAGLQPAALPSLRPWLRAGWFRGSGDRSATDGRHETFFQTLPTPRPYARMPFYNLMNADDLFGSLLLRPGARVTMRADVHRLRLAEPTDLWYAGGGAFEDASFGFAGRPSGGGRGLATLADLSIDVRVTPRVTVSLYGARAGAGEVIRGVYPGTGPAWLGYLELEVRR